MDINTLIKNIYYRFKERQFENRLKYIFVRKHSKTLIISFSGFSSKPAYNYMRTLKTINADQLFILDDFGIRGSYYWFENGEDRPLVLTQALIAKVIVNAKKYDKIITIGSSKGGTCAIYYGLIFNANEIYAGAPQYYAGRYLNTEEHAPILKAMMGDCSTDSAQNILDRMLPDIIKRSTGINSKIHLLYSKEEHTYSEHIRYMIQDFHKYNIPYFEQVESFEDHAEVGNYFIPYLKQNLKKHEL